MNEPERTPPRPRKIRRTLKPGESWTIRNIDAATISIEYTDRNAKETVVTAEVIDKLPTIG